MADQVFWSDVFDAFTAAAGQGQINNLTGIVLGCMAYPRYWDYRVAGWVELQRNLGTPSGFSAIAYWHPASHSLCVCYRGADGFNSLDWGTAAQMAISAAPGQIPDAVAFFKSAYGAALGTIGGAPSNIYIAGHSLGGGLGDGIAILARNLVPGGFPGTISGLGFASAGFKTAFEAYAQHNGIGETLADAINHYVRKQDFVPNHPARSIYGTDITIGSVYRGMQEMWGKPQMMTYTWTAPLDTNHDQTLYFKYFATDQKHHVWKDSNGRYTAKTGRQPLWKRQIARPQDY